MFNELCWPYYYRLELIDWIGIIRFPIVLYLFLFAGIQHNLLAFSIFSIPLSYLIDKKIIDNRSWWQKYNEEHYWYKISKQQTKGNNNHV